MITENGETAYYLSANTQTPQEASDDSGHLSLASKKIGDCMWNHGGSRAWNAWNYVQPKLSACSSWLNQPIGGSPSAANPSSLRVNLSRLSEPNSDFDITDIDQVCGELGLDKNEITQEDLSKVENRVESFKKQIIDLNQNEKCSQGIKSFKITILAKGINTRNALLKYFNDHPDEISRLTSSNLSLKEIE